MTNIHSETYLSDYALVNHFVNGSCIFPKGLQIKLTWVTLRRSHGARKHTTDAVTAVALIQIVFGVFKSLVTLERLTAIRDFAIRHSAVII